MTGKNKTSAFETINASEYIWKTPRKIKSAGGKLNCCPYCKNSLKEGFSLIPVGNEKRAKVPGFVCGKCDILFVKCCNDVKEILIDNLAAKDFSLNGTHLWDYSEKVMEAKKQEELNKKKQESNKREQEKTKLLNRIESSILLICAKSCDEKRNDINIVITNSKQNKDSDKAKILYYSDPKALEALTGAFVDERAKKFCFENVQYSVCGVYKSERQNDFFHNRLMPSKIEIKRDGGYISSVKNKFSEVVDLFLYSPYTNRLEIAHATLDKLTNECYMDINVYRGFVQEYGNPRIFPYVKETRSLGYYNNEIELNDESILHAYGYNLSEGLSDAERHSLLAEIVDLELLTVSHIVFHLDFLMKLNKKKDRALFQWENDKQFIENYKVNPNRFLIASKKY